MTEDPLGFYDSAVGSHFVEMCSNSGQKLNQFPC